MLLTPDRHIPGDWYPHPIPPNVLLDATAHVESAISFKRMLSKRPDAVVLGPYSSAYLACQFDLAPNAVCTVGQYTLMNGAHLLVTERITIGSYCLISWNVVIADSDFHPLDPAQRRLDAIALAPNSPHPVRQVVAARPVIVEDDVWIGFNVSILKGMTIGRGSVIGAGSVVTRDVPAYSVVVGNPGRVVRTLDPITDRDDRSTFMTAL